MSTILPTSPITPSTQQGFIPNTPIVARFDIPISRVITAFTTPITLLPARVGYLNLPLWAVLTRTAPATPYLAQGNILKLAWNTLGVDADVALNLSATSLTAAATNNNYAVFCGPPNHAGLDGSDLAAGFGSKPLMFIATVSNPTVNGTNTGTDLTLLLSYVILPTYQANIGSY